MSERDNGGPAFPGGMVSVGDGDHQPFASGMTLRDWFAGQADISGVTGLLHKEGCEALIGRPMPNGSDMAGLVRWHFDVSAQLKLMAADAMLEARK